MVAMFESVFVIVCVVLGVWWFRQTTLYRARRSGVDPGQYGNHKLTGRGDQNMSGPR